MLQYLYAINIDVDGNWLAPGNNRISAISSEIFKFVKIHCQDLGAQRKRVLLLPSIFSWSVSGLLEMHRRTQRIHLKNSFPLPVRVQTTSNHENCYLPDLVTDILSSCSLISNLSVEPCHMIRFPHWGLIVCSTLDTTAQFQVHVLSLKHQPWIEVVCVQRLSSAWKWSITLGYLSVSGNRLSTVRLKIGSNPGFWG